MRHLDLFSGIGGFALAARWMGWETVAFCEREPFCQRVLAKHWPEVVIHDDIATMDAGRYVGRVDILTGGFPCQPVSLAGQRKGAADDRWLWPDMLRIVRAVRPAWVVAENVPGLRNLGADGVLADLEAAHYTAWPLVVGADDIGAVHRRKRVWIVAHANTRGFGAAERNLYARQSDASGRSEDAAHAEGRGWTTEGQRWREEFAGPGSTGKGGNAAHAHGARLAQRLDQRGDGGQEQPAAVGGYRTLGDRSQAPEPTICGMDDGLPRRLDRRPRLAALGNAIVPQIAFTIFRAIELQALLF